MIQKLKTILLSYRPAKLGTEVAAGAGAAIAAIPDSMASAVLAGVNPVHGLYAVMVGMPVATFATSSVYMSVVTTSALAVSAGEVLSVYPEGSARIGALSMLVLLVAVFQIAIGMLRLGGTIRFVSHSVMTGFITGIGVLVVLSQLGDFTGFDNEARGAFRQSIEIISHLDRIDLASTLTGIVTVALILALEFTPLRRVAMLAALVVAAILVHVFSWKSVSLVGDSGKIMASLPQVSVPDFSLFMSLTLPALGLALISVIQGAGVSQSYSNPDGRFSNISRDAFGQGMGNVFSALFGGMPIGASVSGTAIIVAGGASSRLAHLLCAVFIGATVLFFGALIEKLPYPSLAGLLLLAGFRGINFNRIRSVFKTSTMASAAMLITFAATFLLPLHFAIVLGITVSILLNVFNMARDVSLTSISIEEWPLPREGRAPSILPGNKVTVLLPHGSLFFAGARHLEKLLPEVNETSRNAVVLLMLRGHEDFGSTFLDVLSRYAQNVNAVGGSLMLTGVGENLARQLKRTGVEDILGTNKIFPATSRYGEAFLLGVAAAQAYIQNSAPKH